MGKSMVSCKISLKPIQSSFSLQVLLYIGGQPPMFGPRFVALLVKSLSQSSNVPWSKKVDYGHPYQ